ncbi:hypothetical protein [Clostridium thermarum]|uniref:hypothetical protein n=1 Tax=Clostridium thermarum TaxID=1716543 RepID=UPI00111DDDE1|nr:hypothetical protein [Clostridium thermarum]
MDWNNEIKILNRALKQYKMEKNKLEISSSTDNSNHANQIQYLILQKELLIQNVESRIKIAEKKLSEEVNKK